MYESDERIEQVYIMAPQLCVEKRKQIVGLWQTRVPLANIVQTVQCTEKTALRWIERFRRNGEEGLYDHRLKNRRPRKTTEEQDRRLIEAFDTDPFALVSRVTAEIDYSASKATARRRLREAGFRCRRAVRNFSLLSLQNNDETDNQPDPRHISPRNITKSSKMSEITEVSSNKVFGGWQKVYSHESKELNCKMNFAIFLPPQSEEHSVPVIYWLSGLTCTEANFVQKAGAQRYAAEQGVILVAPDTSPRGLNIPGEDDSWDFGTGASFYVDATKEPWKKNYRMYSYITKELLELVNAKFPVIPGQQSIMGHSMGGHGALICAMKNPYLYKSVSAFAPISNPTECAWGIKAFSGYLGDDKTAWAEWDATILAKKYNGPPLAILVDQGKEDSYLEQLMPENLLIATQDADLTLILRWQEGYDHSYFFISTFIEDHIKHHVKYLKN